MYTVFIFLHMAFHKTADFQGKCIKITELVTTVFFSLSSKIHYILWEASDSFTHSLLFHLLETSTLFL